MKKIKREEEEERRLLKKEQLREDRRAQKVEKTQVKTSSTFYDKYSDKDNDSNGSPLESSIGDDVEVPEFEKSSDKRRSS